MHITKISSREREVLELIAHEYTTPQIATQLYLSTHTVDSHKKNIKLKLDVKNTAGMVRRGFELGLLKMVSGSAAQILVLIAMMTLVSLSVDAQSEIELRTDGIVVPRTTTSAVSNPIEGQLIYDTTADAFRYYDGSAWRSIGSGGSGAFERVDTLVRQVEGVSSDDFILGRSAIPIIGEMVTDTFFFFDRSRGGVRSGFLSDSDAWSPDSIGLYSMAFGFNTIASGDFGAMATGNQTSASGDFGATALGSLTTASGGAGATSLGFRTIASGGMGATALGNRASASGDNGATALGDETIASGDNGATALGSETFALGNNGATALGFLTSASGSGGATALGSQTTAAGNDGALAVGLATIAAGSSSVAMGRFNDPIVTPGTPVGTNGPLFILGNGTSSSNRNNALVVRQNGQVEFDNFTFPISDGTNGQVMTTDGSGQLMWATVSGLSTSPFERSGTLIRQTTEVDTDDFVFGRSALPANGEIVQDTFFFFDQSKGALRLGIMDGSEGWGPDSIGFSSVALGFTNVASGTAATALGIRTSATGNLGATALGALTEASGDNGSTALGEGTIANGFRGATALGLFTEALGDFGATSLGRNTISTGNSSVAIGQYNDPIVAAGAMVGTDGPLLIVGNGTSGTSRSNAMVVRQNGRVGIGTNNPEATTQVEAVSSRINPLLTLYQDNSSFIRQAYANNTADEEKWYILAQPQQANNTANAFFRIFYTDTDGVADWETDPGINALDIDGNGNAVFAGTVMGMSDLRLKKDIVPLTDALSSLSQINGYRYNWKNRNNSDDQIGLIAQEVQSLYPELVKENEEGMLSVSYTKMVPVLLEAIKEQQEMIKELEKRLENLEAK